jgi:hypothetical protein
MGSMRLRVGALAFVAVIIAALCGAGGCRFSGTSAIYMAIDSAGAQPRDVFYTDSVAIYCIALVSTAKQDLTVDFTIREISGPDGSPPLHNVFAVCESTPGPGTETPVSCQLPPQGIQIQVSCLGYCLQNGVGCPAGYANQGNDSCGPSAECCYNPTAQAAMAPSVLPYPVGDYECLVELDGVLQPETSTFTIEYPPPDPTSGQVCPVPPPVTGVVCAGWVPQKAQCTGFYSYQTCTCDGSAWSCTGTAP